MSCASAAQRQDAVMIAHYSKEAFADYCMIGFHLRYNTLRQHLGGRLLYDWFCSLMGQGNSFIGRCSLTLCKHKPSQAN